MQECGRIESIVRVWEERGTLAPSDLEQITLHCADCHACSKLYSRVLPLLERDARGTRVADSDEPDAGFAERVMQRIGAKAPRKVFTPLSWAAAAAACLLLLAGIGAGVLVYSGGKHTDEVVVHFELDAPGAQSVALVGSFNGWDTSKLPMTDANRDGVWQITVHLKKNSINVYNFVIDGSRWVSDPKSPAQVDDGLGGLSSMLRL
jgi:hypothetical protein